MNGSIQRNLSANNNMTLQTPSEHKAKRLSAPALLLSLFIAVFLTGCATNPDNRFVGKLTYDQAVSQFGKPIKADKDSNGETHAKWLAYESDLVGSILPGRFMQVYFPNKNTMTREAWMELTNWDANCQTNPNHDPLPPGIRIGATRKGKYLHYRNLFFGSDGILKKSDPSGELKWQEWANPPVKKPL